MTVCWPGWPAWFVSFGACRTGRSGPARPLLSMHKPMAVPYLEPVVFVCKA